MTDEKKTDPEATEAGDSKPTDDEANSPEKTGPEADAGPEAGDAGDVRNLSTPERTIKPEEMKLDELRAFVRAESLDAKIDLRRNKATILEELFALRPDLAPPPTPEESEEEELRAKAKEGDEGAAEELDEIERRRREQLEAERAFAEVYAATKPARPWLEARGYPVDIRHVSVAGLVDALFRLAASLDEPPEDLNDALEAWIGLAMSRLDPETRERVIAHREATIRAFEADAIDRATRPTGPEYFIVERRAVFVVDGYVQTLAQGSTVSTTSHDVEELRRQGVPLLRCTSDQARVSSVQYSGPR